MITEIFATIVFSLLPNGTAVIDDFMYQVVKHEDCRGIRAPTQGELGIRTDEAYPHCYIVISEPIMKLVDGQWESTIERTFK